MKKLLIMLFFTILLISCENDKKEEKYSKYPIELLIINGEGMALSNCYIKCDSFNAISATEYDIWRDGVKQKIIASRAITPYSK